MKWFFLRLEGHTSGLLLNVGTTDAEAARILYFSHCLFKAGDDHWWRVR